MGVMDGSDPDQPQKQNQDAPFIISLVVNGQRGATFDSQGRAR
jgi:hypothetical protein